MNINNNKNKHISVQELLDKSSKMKYTSLKYVEASKLHNSSVFINNSNIVFLYAQTQTKYQIYWACETINDFIDSIKSFINATKSSGKNLYIEFIPHDFVKELQNIGFYIESHFLDFWHTDLNHNILKQAKSNSLIRTLETNEYEIAAGITQKCKGLSRGYYGETLDFIRQWKNIKNSEIFAALVNDEVVGIACVNLYGFSSKKGIAMWLREIAVNPKFQGLGIGYDLIIKALHWGIENDAKRSFLACDTDNIKAIGLYEKLGYKRESEIGQINMEMKTANSTV